jgi:hypothetical protein
MLFTASVAVPVATLAFGLVSGGGRGFWNDFSTYWLAGKLVWSGQSPYDLAALVRLGHDQALVFQAGTGYSYPLPFAVAMVPFGWLPFGAAGLLFSLLSLLVFGLSVTAWLTDPRLFRGGRRAAIACAALAGCYPPVVGSILVGQANLLVLGLLVVGVRRLAVTDRAGWGGAALGLAGIVKVVPLALVVPVVIGRRWRDVLGLVAVAGGTLAAAAVLAPFAVADMGRLLRLGEADPYWTNQSLNGFASRLVMPTGQSVPPFPHASAATIAWGAMLVMAAATLGALLWRRARLASWDGLALAVGLALVAATAAAPKDSFWDHVPALIGAGLMLSVPGWQRGRWRAPLFGLVAGWFVLAVAQVVVNQVDGATGASGGPISGYLTSLALYGLVLLWAAIGLALAALPTAAACPERGAR